MPSISHSNLKPLNSRALALLAVGATSLILSSSFALADAGPAAPTVPNDAHHCFGAPGKAHVNGGGYVADTARVEPTVFVNSTAAVCDNARVGDEVKILDSAIVAGDAKVWGRATISRYALVTGNAQVSQRAVVTGWSMVGENAKVYGCGFVDVGAKVIGNALVYGGLIRNTLDCEKDPTTGFEMFGGQVTGYSTVQGYAEIFDHALVGGTAGTGNGLQDIDRTLNGQFVGGAPTISGNAKVSGYTFVGGQAKVYENAQIKGRATVNHSAKIHGSAVIDDSRPLKIIIRSTTLVTDYADVSGNARVESGATVWGYATVRGNAKVMNLSIVACNAVVEGTVEMDNESIITGNVRKAKGRLNDDVYDGADTD